MMKSRIFNCRLTKNTLHHAIANYNGTKKNTELVAEAVFNTFMMANIVIIFIATTYNNISY